MISVEWREVLGFEGYYEVSSDGRVRSVDRIVVTANRWGGANPRRLRGKPIAPWIDKRSGYLKIGLRQPGMKRTVDLHIVVLEAWFGPCPTGMEACHHDDVRLNNCIGNLRWDTRSANTWDSIRNGRRRHDTNGDWAKPVGPTQ
jgi:hypothetical protein